MVGWALILALGAGDKDWECNYTNERWVKAGLQAPCKVLTGATPAARLAAARKAWNLTSVQAQCALEAGTLLGDGHLDDRENAAVPAGLAWRRCLEQWPEHPLFWHAMILTWDHQSDLSSLIAKLPPAPPDGGRALADQLLDIEYGPDAALAAFMLSADPTRLVSLLADPRLRERTRFELAYAALEKRKPTGPEWDALVEPLLLTPLEQGHWLFAAETWMRLPAPLRARAAASVEFAPLEEESRGSLRPRLALGLIALGQKDEAKKIVLPLETKDAGAARGGRRFDDSSLISEAVTWHFTGRRTGTPWDAAVAARLSSELSGWEPWVGLMPFLRPHEALFLEQFGWLEKYELEHPEPESDFTPELGRLLAASSARARQLLKQQVSFPAASVAADAGVVTLPAALDSPFVERSAPWTGPAPQSLDAQKVKVPKQFWAHRAEKQGKRTVVLATSQRFDPVGEVSPGGYWLLVSPNGVDQWKEIYLCLGDHRPFHALATSKIPLLDAADVVRLSMEDAPLDEASITFPPIGTRAPTRRKLVVLEASLKDLSRDTDGDGLADLVEARLLLDPKNKDTDGDGVSDGDDPTPRLDDRLPVTPLAEMYNAFFEDFLSGRKQPQALIVAPGAPPFEARPRTADLDDVRFLKGDARALGGLRPLIRIVTLNEAELGAAKARFGEFYPMRIGITLNGADHAFIEWSEGWRGGSCRIDRDARGTLVVTSLGMWIT